ncbi:MAG: hypothetical protein M3011_14445, partial [Actinomycetota bacterium]|nr:hypothetical protein [Actinomycetota bacterium]
MPWVLSIASVLFIAGYVTWPILASPFWGDDLWSSQVPMVLNKSHQSVWSLVISEVRDWMKFTGRFHPVYVLQANLVHLVFSSRGSYKAYQFAMVLLDIALFVVLVGRLACQRYAGIVAGLFLLATLQISIYSDAMVDFNVDLPTALALMLVALLCGHQYFKTEHRRWLAAATLLWLTAAMAYEVAVLLVPLFVLVGWAAGWSCRSRRTALAVLGLPLLVYVSFVAFLRYTAVPRSERDPSLAGNVAAKQSESEYRTSLDPVELTRTFAIQAIAAAPLTQSTIRRPPHRLSVFAAVASLSAPDIATLVANAALMVFALRRMGQVPNKAVAALFGAGLMLWVIPALLVAQAERWQNELRLGSPFMSVYLEFFGVALVLAAFVVGGLGLVRRRPSPISHRGEWTVIVVLAALSALVVQVTATNNRRELALIRPVRLSTELFDRGVDRGVFGGVTANSTVLAVAGPAQYPWVNECAIAWHGGPDINLIRPPDPFGKCSAPPTMTLHGGDDGEPSFVLWTSGGTPAKDF